MIGASRVPMNVTPAARDADDTSATVTRAASGPLRVLVCAAHAHLLWGLSKLVAGEWPRMLMVGAFSTMAAAEAYLRAHAAEVALMGFPAATEDELAELRRLCASYPTAFVVLDGNPARHTRLAEARVEAVLPLDASGAQIVATLSEVSGPAEEPRQRAKAV